MERTITAEQTARFVQALQAADRAPGTIENYLRHVRAFARWLGHRPLSPGERRPVAGQPFGAGLHARHRQQHDRAPEPLLSVSGVERL